MEIVELLQANWINLVIIFVLPFVCFIYKKRTKNDYFDNVIKYADILEKTPQPKYQKDYLNNIKKKLLWDKVCFYKSGNINKERIAISLVNADITNIINLSYLDALTQYFSIKRNRIAPLMPFMIPEIIITFVAFIVALIIVITNLYTLCHSIWLVTTLIAALTIFVVMIVASRFAVSPIKRINTYRLILKDKDFLQRANNELANIIRADQQNDRDTEIHGE